VAEFAHLNVWQTDEAGQHVKEGYRGAVSPDRQGRFSVAGVMPTAYHDAEGVLRAPHLHVAVFAPRVWQQVFETEMFFPGDRVAKRVDPGFAVQNEIEFELQSNGSLPGYFNIFLASFLGLGSDAVQGCIGHTAARCGSFPQGQGSRARPRLLPLSGPEPSPAPSPVAASVGIGSLIPCWASFAFVT